MNAPDETVEEGTITPGEGASGDDPGPGDSGGPRAATGRLRGLFARLLTARSALVAGLAAVLLLVGGTAVRLQLPTAENDTAGPSVEPVPASNAAPPTPDRLVEQELSPFYIPLPREKDGQMARVSFSVTWDRPSSSRFRSQEPRVRDRLFRRMTELAAEGESMRSMSLTLRTEARKILEKLLRPEELRVVVTGIFIV
jgi:hypothetical protein